jgi:hypothetical protein
VAVALGAIVLLGERVAAARANGIVAPGCSGCHGGGAAAIATLVASQTTINPGDLVTLTLTIQSSSIKDGGAYITTGGVGTLRAISGEGLATNTIDGLTHTTPRAASGSQVTFRFNWQAPSTPGGVDIQAYVVAGNGNNSSSGDATGSVSFQAVYGCTGHQFFWDGDGDGSGDAANGVELGCANAAPPTQFAPTSGDCNDNDPAVHPGATEICNGKDDNCNGQTDENAPAVMLWPDPDGDGYYQYQTGTPKLGCGGIAGYAAASGDCAPMDATVHPGAKEVCNGKDDNCDGRTDEGVRPRCGIGWCERESPTCDASLCVAGPPHLEACNLLDDDCDGEVDNGATCPDGLQCVSGACMSGGSSLAGTAGNTGGGASSGGPGSGGTTGAGATTGTGTSGQPQMGGGSSCRTIGESGGRWSALLGFLAALALAKRRSGGPGD